VCYNLWPQTDRAPGTHRNNSQSKFEGTFAELFKWERWAGSRTQIPGSCSTLESDTVAASYNLKESQSQSRKACIRCLQALSWKEQSFSKRPKLNNATFATTLKHDWDWIHKQWDIKQGWKKKNTNMTFMSIRDHMFSTFTPMRYFTQHVHNHSTYLGCPAVTSPNNSTMTHHLQHS
jgi:hypothetical protein